MVKATKSKLAEIVKLVISWLWPIKVAEGEVILPLNVDYELVSLKGPGYYSALLDFQKVAVGDEVKIEVWLRIKNDYRKYDEAKIINKAAVVSIERIYARGMKIILKQTVGRSCRLDYLLVRDRRAENAIFA
jgi:hypothetical protein